MTVRLRSADKRATAVSEPWSVISRSICHAAGADQARSAFRPLHADGRAAPGSCRSVSSRRNRRFPQISSDHPLA